jgi:arsenite-transporting ATPase
MENGYIFIGKGGVGKTTCSAAMALGLAQKGKTLIASLDPAHNLGDVYGVRLSGTPKKINQSLYAMEVDIDELARKYIERTVNRIKDMYTYLKVLNLDKYVESLKYSPGIEEYSILEALIDLFSANYDYVILDMPPTGLTVKTLTLPYTTLIWIEKLIRLRKDILSRRMTIESITGKKCVVIDGKEVEIPVSEEEDPIFRELKQKKEKMEFIKNFLTGDKCSFILVTNPEALSLFEGERAIKTLKNFGINVSKIIINKFVEHNDVTKKISQLGSTLKIPLFDREPRGMDELTKIFQLVEVL